MYLALSDHLITKENRTGKEDETSGRGNKIMRSSLSETVRVCRVARGGEHHEAHLLQWEKTKKIHRN